MLSPETGAEPPKAESDTVTPATGSNEPMKTVGTQGPRGTKQTFAGRRLPQGNEASETFYVRPLKWPQLGGGQDPSCCYKYK